MGVTRTGISLLVAALAALAGCDGKQSDPGRPTQRASATSSPSPLGEGLAGPPSLAEVGSFDSPIHLTSAPSDERIFVVEQQGRVKILGSDAVFLDIVGDVSSGGERGLFSIAFSPGFADDGLAYLSYTDTKGDSRIVEYKVSQDRARLDPSTRREILFVDQPFANHNGGLILFDPSGMLLVGLGDGGSGGDPDNRAQNLGDLLGKVLRIDPRTPDSGKPYGIPKDNPFLASNRSRPEVWAYGLRNPWRFSFDPQTKDLYLGDVGQNRFEEVNWVPVSRQSGANYGWRAFEGNSRFTDDRIDESRLVKPVLTFPTRSGRTCAVTGGHVYRGQVRDLRGHYVYGDYCEGELRAFRIENGEAKDQRPLGLKVSSIPSFGEDSKGDLYVLTHEGKIFKIVAAQT